MLAYELLPELGVLIVRPEGKIEDGDFQRLAEAVDPLIETHGDLRGLLIEAESFPGWADFSALLEHMKFVKDHHRHIAKVAAVTDSTFLSIMPSVATHFVKAEVKHFDFAKREEALEWLTH